MISDREILDEYARYKYVVDNIKVAIWELDTNLSFTFVSPTVKALTGYDAGQMIGRSMLSFLTDASRDFTLNQIGKRIAGGHKGNSPLYDVEFVCKDGLLLWLEVCVKPIFQDGKLICYVGTSRDISEKKMYEAKLNEMLQEQKRVNEKLENMLTFDMLTGAYNRRKLDYYISRETKKAKEYGTSFSIGIFDIDNFKQVNDVNGHDKGDYVLRDIAERIKRTLRSTDRLFRWGGDEFIVLLPDSNLNNALVVVNKIKEIVQSCPFDIDGKRVTISLGVAPMIRAKVWISLSPGLTKLC
jgi:diguanylate cyclase (GGDEF)-like protein/PAS domain S-box-containing protein